MLFFFRDGSLSLFGYLGKHLPFNKCSCGFSFAPWCTDVLIKIEKKEEEEKEENKLYENRHGQIDVAV